MLILGDLALTKMAPQVLKVKARVDAGEHILFNLEGASLSDFSVNKEEYDNIVFNSSAVVSDIASGEGFIFGVCNNHIFDDPNLGVDTLEYLHGQSALCVGAWSSMRDFSLPLQVREGSTTVSVISAGWDVIGCLDHGDYGVNQLIPEKLIAQVVAEKKRSDRVVVYLHWGYELEIYPHPADRKLAYELIDAGADIIVGCHAHCILGHEKYKGKNIFFGLGNFAFSQGVYYGGRIKFPDICKYGLCVSYHPDTGSVSILGVCNDSGDLIDIDSDLYVSLMGHVRKLSDPFALHGRAYARFFKKNRRKKKMLPVFLSHNKSVRNSFKKIFLRVRGSLLNFMLCLGLKGGPQ